MACPVCGFDQTMITQTHVMEKTALRMRVGELEAALDIVKRHRQEIVDLISDDTAREIIGALHKAGVI